MDVKLFIVFYSFLNCYAKSAVTYDQRQTGALNVQVDLKDLRVIALLKGGKEEYVDYDYAYDYSEMTIKPQNGTTPKPLNGSSTLVDSIKDNTTATTPAAGTLMTEQTLVMKNNNLQNFEAAETTALYSINEIPTTTVKNLEVTSVTAAEVSDAFTTRNISSTTSTLRPNLLSTLATGCKKGFVMNQKGDCELKLQGAGNALLKLVKLSQKLKLRRENRRHEDTSSV